MLDQRRAVPWHGRCPKQRRDSRSVQFSRGAASADRLFFFLILSHYFHSCPSPCLLGALQLQYLREKKEEEGKKRRDNIIRSSHLVSWTRGEAKAKRSEARAQPEHNTQHRTEEGPLISSHLIASHLTLSLSSDPTTLPIHRTTSLLPHPHTMSSSQPQPTSNGMTNGHGSSATGHLAPQPSTTSPVQHLR